MSDSGNVDVVLVGAGVMSATLGAFLHLLNPTLTITVYESLDTIATESSDAWNNAGTGHQALCELNYTPEGKNGAIDIARAIKINEQFQQSKQFWANMVEHGLLRNPKSFINSVAHMSFVHGESAVDFLRRRYEALKSNVLFEQMEFSTDRAQLQQWIPLMMDGRAASDQVAATYVAGGTDLDFGALTRELFGYLAGSGVEVKTSHRVQGLSRMRDGRWKVRVASPRGTFSVRTRFIFLGAGGGALHLLQKSGIPEGRGYGGFPVSGQWLRCENRDLIEHHAAKVYGKPALGAPPMSVPHLDTRVIGGKKELLFGPFAGFSTKFLKGGSYLDLPLSIKPGNLYPMLKTGIDNVDLTKYLIGQVLQSQEDRIAALREFVPLVKAKDWRLEVAGQRVQIIKKHPQKGGVLEFGTEVIRASDGSLAALLGASPGASTAVSIMLGLIEKGTTVTGDEARAELPDLVPCYGASLANDPARFRAASARNAEVLGLIPGA